MCESSLGASKMKQSFLYAFVFLACVISPASGLAEPAAKAGNPQKAILVTGASSGIGRLIAERLASEGHFVYAGARKPEDIKALSAIPNIEGIRLDVTKQDEIDAAVALVRKRGKGLYGLVNNAGVAVIGPLIEIDRADVEFQMDVNVMGPYLVTRAFAPLIIESKGRISTIGSISGYLTSTLYGPYSMSKFAVEAYSEALASEMERFGVKVSVIEPGSFKSDISLSVRKRREQRGQTTEDSLYEEDFEKALSQPVDRSHLSEPTAVAAAAVHALFDPHPRLRYMVVPNEQQAKATVSAALRRAVQLNQDQPYAYDREALILMLDAALDASRAEPKKPES